MKLKLYEFLPKAKGFFPKVFLRRLSKAILILYKRPKGFIYYCLDLFSAWMRLEKSLGFPVHITIEPTNICNLKCPVCETGSDIIKRPKGMIRFEDFKTIADKSYKYTNSIMFYYMGEPFLNNESYEMIKYAHDRGIYVTTCTNGSFIDAAKLIGSGIDEVSFQIGGITEESHKIYRVGSSLNDIIQNIKDIVHKKKVLKKTQPKIIIGLIVMKHNESQVGGFYKFAEELEVDESRILYPRVRTLEQGKQFLTVDEKYWFYDKESFEKDGLLKPKYLPHNRCNWMYFSTVVLCNGDVVPCCRDADADFVMGNLLKENLASIWNGKRYRKFRREIRQSQNKIKLCRLCSDFGIPSLYTSNT